MFSLSFFVNAFISVVMTSSAWAQEAAAPAAGKTPSMFENILPLVAFFAIFYFLIIRPQSKKAKDHQSFVTQLKRGDNVITSGGIFGKIEGITEQFVTLEVSDGVQIRILKTQISTPVKEGKANV